MTRDEAKQFLIDNGVAEPTDEAVTNLLNTIQKSVKSADDRANRYKEDSMRAKDLAKELEELKSANLSDVEKANKATEDALKQVADLQKTVSQMQLAKELAEIGIVGDDAEGLFNDDGSLNVSKLGEIVTGREKKAVADFEKEALLKTPNPEGGEPDSEKDTPDVAYAKDYVARAKSNNNAQSIINQYIGGE